MRALWPALSCPTVEVDTEVDSSYTDESVCYSHSTTSLHLELWVPTRHKRSITSHFLFSTSHRSFLILLSILPPFHVLPISFTFHPSIVPPPSLLPYLSIYLYLSTIECYKPGKDRHLLARRKKCRQPSWILRHNLTIIDGSVCFSVVPLSSEGFIVKVSVHLKNQ